MCRLWQSELLALVTCPVSLQTGMKSQTYSNFCSKFLLTGAGLFVCCCLILICCLYLCMFCMFFYATANEADAYMFYRCFFFVFCYLLFVFSVRHKNTTQLFSGTAEWIFMKLLPNDSGENVVYIAVPSPRLIFWG